MMMRPTGANPEQRGVATADARVTASTTRASRSRARDDGVVLYRSVRVAVDRRRAVGRDGMGATRHSWG